MLCWQKHCWRGCEFILLWLKASPAPCLDSGKRLPCFVHYSRLSIRKFCCTLTVLPDDLRAWDTCSVQGWKSCSGWKRALAGILVSGINDKARGWIHQPRLFPQQITGEGRAPSQSVGLCSVIRPWSEHQIKWRCTTPHLATRYSLLCIGFIAQWNKTKTSN